jgi:hypothetical protein
MQVLQNQALLRDDRSNCLSVTLITSAGDYLAFIKRSYENKGGLEGQRVPLKTKTAIKIRTRMVDDLLHGAVLPPIVIGVVPRDAAEMQTLTALAESGHIAQLTAQIEAVEPAQIAIIDGMQRTTALLEAAQRNSANISSRPVRLELWIGQNTNSLIYRMLVLNTGQVPWDIKRQLETVYTFLLKEIRQRVADISVFKIDDRSRRTSSGEYQSSIIIESYFAFTSRKPNVDVRERVAEDFARLDATESAADSSNLERFIEALHLVVALDAAFSRYVIPRASDPDPEARFTEGRDIFSVRAAVVGFVSAAAVSIYGEPGFVWSSADVASNAQRVSDSVSALANKLNALTPDEVGEFLQLDILRQLLGERTGGVGDFERAVFHRAFLSAIKHGAALPSMLPCWRAH